MDIGKAIGSCLYIVFTVGPWLAATSFGLWAITLGVIGVTTLPVAWALLVAVAYWFFTRVALYAAVRSQGLIYWGEGFPVLFAYWLTMPIVGETFLYLTLLGRTMED